MSNRIGVYSVFSSGVAVSAPVSAPGADQHLDFVRRLRADAQPIVDPLAVEHGSGIDLGDHGIVGTEFFQHAAVARRADIHRTNAKEGAMPPAEFLHPNTY